MTTTIRRQSKIPPAERDCACDGQASVQPSAGGRRRTRVDVEELGSAVVNRVAGDHGRHDG